MSQLPRRRFLQIGAAAAAMSGCGVDERRARFPSVSMLRGRIQHFVVLMMENRSYDQMLGSLPGRKYGGTPSGTILRYRTPDGRSAAVPVRHGTPRDSFYPDPPHRFAKVARQIYGSGPDAPADMSGFAQVFSEERPIFEQAAASVEDYATHYADGKLPILQTLAKEYGVCTHWFASVPAATTPNRMFAHAGTSAAVTAQGAYYSRLKGKMIFDELGKNPWLWRVYFHDAPHLWLTGDFWTRAFARQLRRIDHLYEDVQNDSLPVYTFIEPRHVIAPWNNQHPFMGVSHGEELIARVYNDLVSNSRVFEKTLLLVVYDEHGGFFDHVVPPGHRGWQPDPGVEHDVIAPSRPAPDGFDFTKLGPRVPAVVVSPWIQRGSAFGWNSESPEDRWTFDHTSILATVGAMTGRWVVSPRARAATPLDVTLNRATPRTDASKLAYRSGDYRSGGGRRPSTSDGELEGVAKELCEAWRAEHRQDATPERIVAYYDELVQRGDS